MRTESAYTVTYTNTWAFLKKSLNWSCGKGVAVRVSLTDGARHRYNLECTILEVNQDNLLLRCVELISLADLVTAECVLYVNSAPQTSGDHAAVSGRAGVFVCQAVVREQKADEAGHCLLVLDSVKHFDFRELRKHHRACPSSGAAMAVIWRCGASVPVDASRLPSPDYVYQPGGQSNLKIMDVSAGGARLRVPHNAEGDIQIKIGEHMLCTFSLIRLGTQVNLKVLVIGRVVSCQPVSKKNEEVRLQFIHVWQGTDKNGCWVWGRLGQDGVPSLKRWMEEDLPHCAGEAEVAEV